MPVQPMNFDASIAAMDSTKQTLQSARDALSAAQAEVERFRNRIEELEILVGDLQAKLDSDNPHAMPGTSIRTNPIVKTPEPIETAIQKPQSTDRRVEPSRQVPDRQQPPDNETKEKTLTKP